MLVKVFSYNILCNRIEIRLEEHVTKTTIIEVHLRWSTKDVEDLDATANIKKVDNWRNRGTKNWRGLRKGNDHFQLIRLIRHSASVAFPVCAVMHVDSWYVSRRKCLSFFLVLKFVG